MIKYDKVHIDPIRDAAKHLDRTQETFTRRDIIEHIKQKYPDVNPDTVNPMIQGMTVNAPGGAPGALGSNVLYRVGRGRYKLNK